MRDEPAIFATALRFLTRLPLFSGVAFSNERFRAAPRYYPLVGLIVGGLLAALFYACSLILPQPVAALLTVAAGIVLTGGLHEDGFADFCDGLGAGDDKQRIVEIMRDSAIGSYGVIGLVLLIGLKVMILSLLPVMAVVMALPLAHGVSRTAIYMALYLDRPASDKGLGRMAGAGERTALHAALLMIYVPGLALAALFAFGPCGFAIAGAVVLAAHLLLARSYRRRLGGYTGDCLGALQQVTEAAALLGLLASYSEKLQQLC